VLPWLVNCNQILPVVNHFYFDHNATTPLAPEVLHAHTEALRDVYGNASSIHQAGQEARRRLENARRQVAGLIGAHPKEIVFCSGGTEANNTALLGAVRGREHAHVITTAIEHPAVLQPCQQLAGEGAELTYLQVGSSGVVDPDDVRRALRPNTVLISVMHVNNEIGTIQPIGEIAAIARETGILMHSDGVQAAGRIAVNVPADLYSISGHKMYAPKGVGVLYVRKDTPARPLLFGGRHENGWRPGTENVPAVVALGAAAELARERLDEDSARLSALRDRLEQRIEDLVPDIRINARHSPRLPNTTNICFEGIEGEAIVIALDLQGFSVSSGAACSSGAVEPSHVLTAIGLSRRDAKSCIRFSLGRSNTVEQVDALAEAVESVTARLRRISTDYVATTNA
jgi:cysteine desulfurase